MFIKQLSLLIETVFFLQKITRIKITEQALTKEKYNNIKLTFKFNLLFLLNFKTKSL
ncbi:hypothetical protein VIBNISFn27_900032 [Vibrio nigripulchritudo SFn27]|uniref:Uncharacterized protein n=1 Tax=Vibrio nigripulchritudo TaxID=28173 RepID=U4KEH2_9VIBR|nr:hypothetical protein VIBNIBLFn1_210032 [Vibrio nigripulchritudo BLFn1]CCN91224.1 hypothetical protein VIBNISFn27_900032 [Vibrio nigripulchritudo SFn27]CCN96323.1 hypothetical protein VIBNIENn2_740031 [Vibrio nigripulchritudo ENn2]CCO38539.1 hypothetical protein VIBNISFn135_1010032 [Vibrio nigripulchritudo SFn135]CCO50432.1 hypothetical protein VIBNIWn13_100030 [Vibrio nigripulchritudo Wn13]CCO61541.1 hypothetical protein VIBNI_B1817 [Vibrio nigripulchritudo]